MKEMGRIIVKVCILFNEFGHGNMTRSTWYFGICSVKIPIIDHSLASSLKNNMHQIQSETLRPAIISISSDFSSSMSASVSLADVSNANSFPVFVLPS